tara:strand:+ start:264 stop:512 length:249 start_codon:yes stop_codon:yes gene_type:complete
MSFLQNSVTNHTPILHFDNELDDNNLFENDPLGKDTSYVKYNEIQRKLRDEIINYNFQRFINGQLAITIMSLILFNYQLMKD